MCVRQLEDLLALHTLLCLPGPRGTPGGALTRCSVKALLESGTGGEVLLLRECSLIKYPNWGT